MDGGRVTHSLGADVRARSERQVAAVEDARDDQPDHEDAAEHEVAEAVLSMAERAGIRPGGVPSGFRN